MPDGDVTATAHYYQDSDAPVSNEHFLTVQNGEEDKEAHLVYRGLTANNTRCHVFRHVPSKKGCDQNCTQLSWMLLELVGRKQG